MDNVVIGLDKVLKSPSHLSGFGRLGLICNQSSVSADYRYSADLFHGSKDFELTALFGPQHGIRGEVQDNMVETSHSTDKETGLPVYSLYSETREPTDDMLNSIDSMVFDLQDIGGRVYTFIYTMAFAMKACKRNGKRFVVLDRPNPIGGSDVEGALLESGHESFVGQYPIPMRHGMTCGELAQMFNEEFGIGCDLSVIKMDNWSRDLYQDQTSAPWVIPSPNMPTVDTAVVFPGTVFFEGTEASEGRGTTMPFEFVGAPYVRAAEYCNHLNNLSLEGVYFRPTGFQPTFQKFKGESCGGAFIHVTDREVFKPVATGIAMVAAMIKLYGDSFEWKKTPYEYEYDRNPFDVIAGSLKLREQIEAGTPIGQISDSWREDEMQFLKQRSPYLIY